MTQETTPAHNSGHQISHRKNHLEEHCIEIKSAEQPIVKDQNQICHDNKIAPRM